MAHAAWRTICTTTLSCPSRTSRARWRRRTPGSSTARWSSGDDGLSSGLRGLAEGTPVAHVVSGAAAVSRGPVFVFSGHGCQWPGMAVDLLEQSPVFAAHLRACAEALAPHVDFDVEGVLRGDAGQPPLERVDVVQPVLFAVMVSLAALWRAVRRRACRRRRPLAGRDRRRLRGGRTVARGRGPRRGAPQPGAAGALRRAAGSSRCRSRPRRWRTAWTGSPAGSSSPPSTPPAWSPCRASPTRSTRCWRAARRTASGRAGAIDYAAHSPQVEEVRAELLEALARVAPRAGGSRCLDDDRRRPRHRTMDAAYWFEGERRPVQLDAVARRLLDDGHRASSRSARIRC